LLIMDSTNFRSLLKRTVGSMTASLTGNRQLTLHTGAGYRKSDSSHRYPF